MIGRLEEQVEKEARDLQVLQVVVEQGPIGIVRISNETGLPEHKVRYSLRMLENDELVDPTPKGAVPADDIAERIERINRGLADLAERLEDIGVESFPGPE